MQNQSKSLLLFHFVFWRASQEGSQLICLTSEVIICIIFPAAFWNKKNNLIIYNFSCELNLHTIANLCLIYSSVFSNWFILGRVGVNLEPILVHWVQGGDMHSMKHQPITGDHVHMQFSHQPTSQEGGRKLAQEHAKIFTNGDLSSSLRIEPCSCDAVNTPHFAIMSVNTQFKEH